MIAEWFLQLAAGFVGWLADLFGPWEPPDVLTDPDSGVKSLLEGMAGIGAWVDWGVLALCISVSLGVWAAVFGIKLVRAVLAHVPLVGGSGD